MVEDENIEIDIIEQKMSFLNGKANYKVYSFLVSVRFPLRWWKQCVIIRKTRSNQRNQVFSAWL